MFSAGIPFLGTKLLNDLTSEVLWLVFEEIDFFGVLFDPLEMLLVEGLKIITCESNIIQEATQNRAQQTLRRKKIKKKLEKKNLNTNIAMDWI